MEPRTILSDVEEIITIAKRHHVDPEKYVSLIADLVSGTTRHTVAVIEGVTATAEVAQVGHAEHAEHDYPDYQLEDRAFEHVTDYLRKAPGGMSGTTREFYERCGFVMPHRAHRLAGWLSRRDSGFIHMGRHGHLGLAVWFKRGVRSPRHS